MATTPPQTLVNVSADPALNTIYPATAQRNLFQLSLTHQYT
jgi:hypothetical protein